jgi:hypothetical protein
VLPDTTILVFGIGANLLGFPVIAVAPTPAFLYVVSAPLQAIGSALWRPSLSSLITKLVSNREQVWPTAAHKRHRRWPPLSALSVPDYCLNESVLRHHF